MPQYISSKEIIDAENEVRVPPRSPAALHDPQFLPGRVEVRHEIASARRPYEEIMHDFSIFKTHFETLLSVGRIAEALMLYETLPDVDKKILADHPTFIFVSGVYLYLRGDIDNALKYAEKLYMLKNGVDLYLAFYNLASQAGDETSAQKVRNSVSVLSDESLLKFDVGVKEKTNFYKSGLIGLAKYFLKKMDFVYCGRCLALVEKDVPDLVTHPDYIKCKKEVDEYKEVVQSLEGEELSDYKVLGALLLRFIERFDLINAHNYAVKLTSTYSQEPYVFILAARAEIMIAQRNKVSDGVYARRLKHLSQAESYLAKGADLIGDDREKYIDTIRELKDEIEFQRSRPHILQAKKQSEESRSGKSVDGMSPAEIERTMGREIQQAVEYVNIITAVDIKEISTSKLTAMIKCFTRILQAVPSQYHARVGIMYALPKAPSIIESHLNAFLTYHAQNPEALLHAANIEIAQAEASTNQKEKMRRLYRAKMRLVQRQKIFALTKQEDPQKEFAEQMYAETTSMLAVGERDAALERGASELEDVKNSAMVFMQQGDVRSAKPFVHRLIRAGIQDHQVWRWLFFVALLDGDLDEAYSTYHVIQWSMEADEAKMYLSALRKLEKMYEPGHIGVGINPVWDLLAANNPINSLTAGTMRFRRRRVGK